MGRRAGEVGDVDDEQKQELTIMFMLVIIMLCRLLDGTVGV